MISAAVLPSELEKMHAEFQSWRLVGLAIGGYSGAYARMVARGQRKVQAPMLSAFAVYKSGAEKLPTKPRPDTWTLRCPGEWRQHMTPAEARSILALAITSKTS